MIFEPQQLILGSDPNVDGNTPRVRFVDSLTTQTPEWDLARRADGTLAIYNHATSTPTAWADADDVWHVQDLQIEGASSIDAGALDGLDSSQFVRSDADTTINASLAVAGDLTQSGDAVLTQADEGSLDAGTLSGATLSEVRPAINDDGTVIHTAPVTIDTGQYMQARASGDTVTLDAIGGNAVGARATASGDDQQTTFTLSHDLGTPPASVDVTPLTQAARGAHVDPDSVTATSLDVVFETPPPAGTDNLEWYVTAFGDDGSGLATIAVDDDGTRVAEAETLDFTGGLDVTAPSDGVAEISSPPGVEVRDDTTAVQAAPTHIDFQDNLTAETDGDGVTVAGSDTYPSVSADGSVVLAAPTDVNFADNLAVIDDDDGTVTVHASGDAATLNGASGDQYLRSDVASDHTATLGVTTLTAATDASTVSLTADLAPDAGVGLTHTAGSSTHHVRPRRDGLQALDGGAELPTDYATTIEADAAVAFVETDADRIAGFVNTNTDSATFSGGVRLGDQGGAPDGVTLDVRGEARFQIETRTDDPANPETGRIWVREDAI